jgi:hypothetical protein
MDTVNCEGTMHLEVPQFSSKRGYKQIFSRRLQKVFKNDERQKTKQSEVDKTYLTAVTRVSTCSVTHQQL